MDLAPVFRSPYHSRPGYQVTDARPLSGNKNENDSEDAKGGQTIDQSQEVSQKGLVETG